MYRSVLSRTITDTVHGVASHEIFHDSSEKSSGRSALHFAVLCEHDTRVMYAQA